MEVYGDHQQYGYAYCSKYLILCSAEEIQTGLEKLQDK